jgi:hypothetical protein
LDATGLDDITSEVYLRQRDCVNVSREVSNYWKAEFFSRERLANPHRVYPALLLGWIREVCLIALVLGFKTPLSSIPFPPPRFPHRYLRICWML